MVKLLKWTYILLVLLVLIGGSFFAYGMNKAEKRLSRLYDITPGSLIIPHNSLSLERGEHLVGALCTGCHGSDLAGRTIFEDDMLATLNAPNLTPGLGGIGKHYSVGDWVLALRHGVGSDGRPLFVMPSKDLNHICADDLSAMIAYLGQLEAVDNDPGPMIYQPLGKFLVDMGAFGDVINAEGIDHSVPLPMAPEWGNPMAHGDHLVKISGCRGCHGPQLNGGKDPNPEAPPGPNITPGGAAAKWSTEQFIRTLRTGITPDERHISPEFMPWREIGRFTNEELTAIHEYLRSLEPLADAKI